MKPTTRCVCELRDLSADFADFRRLFLVRATYVQIGGNRRNRRIDHALPGGPPYRAARIAARQENPGTRDSSRAINPLGCAPV